MHSKKSALVLFSFTLLLALSFSISSFSADTCSAAGTIISPDDPGPSDVRVTLDSTVSRPISRLIYGVNAKYSDAAGWGPELPPQITLTRLGVIAGRPGTGRTVGRTRDPTGIIPTTSTSRRTRHRVQQ